MESLLVYTRPRLWVNKDLPQRATPYQQVVAMRRNPHLPVRHPLAEPKLWLSLPNRHDPEPVVTIESLSTITLVVDQNFNKNITDFFLTFYRSRLTRLVNGRVNSHRFASWMEGPDSDRAFINAEMDHLPYTPGESTSLNTTLELSLGEHAVVGVMEEEGLRAFHSVVGLGRHSDQCVQVMGDNSYIGIDGLKTTIDSIRAIHNTPNAQLHVI